MLRMPTYWAAPPFDFLVFLDKKLPLRSEPEREFDFSLFGSFSRFCGSDSNGASDFEGPTAML